MTNDFVCHSAKQEQAIFSRAKLTALITGIQWAKGIYYKHNVLTIKGYKRASEITLDDVLVDRNGKPTRLLGIYPQGLQPSYEIELSHGEKFIVDESHLHILKPRSGRKEIVINTRDLFGKKYFLNKAQIPAVSSPIEFPAKSFFISPYVMGVILGDGGISAGSINISNTDGPILDRVRGELPGGMVLKHKSKCTYSITHDRRKTDKSGFSVNLMIDELRRLKLMGLKSHEKFIPESYLYADIEQRLALLQGLMDTDGTVCNNGSKYGRKITYSSTSKELAYGVIWLVESLGGKAWISTHKTTHKDCFRVNIISPLKNPFYLKRKAEKYFVHENTPNKIIKSIRYVGEKETICFAVKSETKSFIIENQIVTHNTTSGAWWMKIGMFEHTDKDDNFLIAAPTYKILNQSTIPAFLRKMDGFGEFKAGDAEFHMYNGGTAYFRTGTDPDSVVGLTNVRRVWGDEAGKFTRYFYENLMGRASFKDAPVMFTSTPYAVNWLYTDILKPYKEGKLENSLIIQARSDENPYFPKEEYERRKRTMDPRLFNAMYNGQFERMQGLVYNGWESVNNIVPAFTLPLGTKFYAGVDWGTTHPFVIVVRGITPTGHHFQVSEFYKTGFGITDMVQVAQRLKQVWGIQTFFCDPAEPGNIKEFNRNGLPAVGAINDIKIGIGLHHELIREGKYKVFEGSSPYTVEEYETYHYPEPKDLKPDQADKEALPVDADNHCCDANRYVTVMTYHSAKRHGERNIGVKKEINPQEARIRKLKRGSRGGHTENWS